MIWHAKGSGVVLEQMINDSDLNSTYIGIYGIKVVVPLQVRRDEKISDEMYLSCRDDDDEH